jgi:hypothetical protein
MEIASKITKAWCENWICMKNVLFTVWKWNELELAEFEIFLMRHSWGNQIPCMNADGKIEKLATRDRISS